MGFFYLGPSAAHGDQGLDPGKPVFVGPGIDRGDQEPDPSASMVIGVWVGGG